MTIPPFFFCGCLGEFPHVAEPKVCLEIQSSSRTKEEGFSKSFNLSFNHSVVSLSISFSSPLLAIPLPARHAILLPEWR